MVVTVVTRRPRPALPRTLIATLVVLVECNPGWAGPASELLPVPALVAPPVVVQPVSNAAFVPGPDATPAPALNGVLHLGRTRMSSLPRLDAPVIGGRDALAFPALDIEFLTLGDVLVPVRRGEFLSEARHPGAQSYWQVIPQLGRVWHEPGDGSWHRAAFPLMLVNDTENHAHQGIATFLYRPGAVSRVRFQFVQQTAPYLLKQHVAFYGLTTATFRQGDDAQLEVRRKDAAAELANRLPARPWADLASQFPSGTLDGFGGPVYPKWLVETALVRDGVLFYQESMTPYGPFPYPLEMRFGVRSIMKSVAAPLALLRLAQVYGPYVLQLHVGAYVHGVDPKYRHVRFIDAANMATGCGGVGSLTTNPNDGFDGYLGGNYDAWYTAPSHAAKLRHMAADLKPYPWEPGTVWRYRDQDYYVLGVALDGFLKSVRGPKADIWDMLRREVLEPIGIFRSPAVRTIEAHGRVGYTWFNAGYYPTLDDLAKIALLYQALGEHDGAQLLHRRLTARLMAAEGTLVKSGDGSGGALAGDNEATPVERYGMGFHFAPYKGSPNGQLYYLPMMQGSGENEVVLYPNRMISIRIAKAAGLAPGEPAAADDPFMTPRIVERLAPF